MFYFFKTQNRIFIFIITILFYFNEKKKILSRLFSSFGIIKKFSKKKIIFSGCVLVDVNFLVRVLAC